MEIDPASIETLIELTKNVVVFEVIIAIQLTIILIIIAVDSIRRKYNGIFK